MEQNEYNCPICNGNDLTLKHEASYVYSYKIDSDKPGLKNTEEFLSYEYDKRENTDNHEYIECNRCGTRFPCSFLNGILSNENAYKS